MFSISTLRSGSVRQLLIALLLASLGGGCVYGAKLREDATLIMKRLASARERGSYRCAPAFLARAEAHLDFLSYELDEGDFQRASWHHRAALQNIEQADAITDPDQCAEKQVIIAEGGDIVIKSTDRDRDGVLDAVDQCPDEPEDIDSFEDANGCPDPDNDGDTVLDIDDGCPIEPGDPANKGCPIPDRDADGVRDSLDLCPDVPEDLDGNQDDDGCPEEDDADGDGLFDNVDKCPTEPEDFDLYQDEDGCPDADNDQDGVLDLNDACPIQPGPSTNAGCPVADRDGDGVMDDLDQCPDVPGKPPKGCPARVLVKVTDTKIEIKEKINFEINAAIIKGDLSFEILNQVGSVLKSNPKLKIVIEGHTDSVGAADYNLKLSDERANAVRQALVDRGVESGRMEAIGYGESKPIASNKSRPGRASNRRVEFNIVKK